MTPGQKWYVFHAAAVQVCYLGGRHHEGCPGENLLKTAHLGPQEAV